MRLTDFKKGDVITRNDMAYPQVCPAGTPLIFYGILHKCAVVSHRMSTGEWCGELHNLFLGVIHDDHWEHWMDPYKEFEMDYMPSDSIHETKLSDTVDDAEPFLIFMDEFLIKQKIDVALDEDDNRTFNVLTELLRKVQSRKNK